MKVLSALCCLLLLLAAGCTSSTRHEYEYNPYTTGVNQTSYAPYYQLQVDFIPDRIEGFLVAQLNRDMLPGEYALKAATRRLLPNDYMVNSEFILYLHNPSNETAYMTFKAISVDHQRLEHSGRVVKIEPKDSIWWSLGRVDVDSRKTSLNARIESITRIHTERDYSMERVTKLSRFSDFGGFRLPSDVP